MKKIITYHYITTENDSGHRLDQVLANASSDYSRNQIKQWIVDGHVTINQQVCTIAKTKVTSHMRIDVAAELLDQTVACAEAITLNKIYEDKDILVINKPAGLVVHPGAGNHNGTLMNALLYDCPDLATLPRAGIIHRLDKDTTGLMLIAKSQSAFHALTQALAERNIKRVYVAIVDGQLTHSQSIDKPIGRHRTHRQKMAVSPSGKPAISHVRLLKRLCGYTLVEVSLETGRTHQIRVHMQSLGHPLLGDNTYGNHRGYQKLTTDIAAEILRFPRQALHATQLSFSHPVTKQLQTCTCPLPDDMQALVLRLSDTSQPSH